MKEIKTKYIRIGRNIFMVEFSQFYDGYNNGIEFKIFNPHKQPRTWLGRVIRFFSNNCSLADGIWYPFDENYQTPYDKATNYCLNIISSIEQYNDFQKAWKNLDESTKDD